MAAIAGRASPFRTKRTAKVSLQSVNKNLLVHVVVKSLAGSLQFIVQPKKMRKKENEI